MKKILILSLGKNLYGTEKFILNLIENIPKNKFEIHWGIPVISDLSKYLEEKNISHFIFNNKSIKKFHIKGLVSIFKYISKNDINIVHSCSGSLPCFVGKYLLRKKSIESRTGIFFSDEQLENFSLKNKFHEFIKQFFADYHIVFTENDKQRMVKYFGFYDKRIRIINLGVDLKEISSNLKLDDKNNKTNIFKFISIGRLTQQKAQDKLIEAVKLLVPTYKNFHLTIVGDGENKKQLTDMIEKYNLNHYITLEGYRNDLLEFMRGFDSLIMSSLYEGVPYVVYNAMSLGLPVVHTDVGGISNIMDNETDALIVPVNDIEKIAEAMIRLATDDELYNSIKHNSKEKVKKYSVERMSYEYETLYNELLNA